MYISITYPSAVSYWLTSHSFISNNNSYVSNRSTDYYHAFLCSALDVGFKMPLHVLISDSAKRRHGKNFHCYSMPDNLPSGSFIAIGECLSVISPELCYLQAAKYLSVPELALLATNLCATYVIDEDSEYGQSDRTPVTSIRKIKSYLNKIKGVHGIKKARIAINFAFDGSHSPRESCIAVWGSLPVCSTYQG